MKREIQWAAAANHLPLMAFSGNPKNPKTHTKKQLAHIRQSILQFGFLDPIGVWGDDNIVVEGHGRLEALKQLVADGIVEIPEAGVPCIRLDHLSRRDRDAYMLEHNQSTMETDWDEALLSELLGDLDDEGLDMSDFGFDVPGDDEDGDGKYTAAVNVPQYEVQGERPNIADMLDSSKADELIREIEQSTVSDEEKAFLIQAARRHNVFNYRSAAEYYAQASPEMQRLMERSALVIIDIGDAIANGFVKLQGEIADMLEGMDDGDA